MVDVLIVGGGFAGTMLAWQCEQRGRSFRIIDSAKKDSASRVAAGIVNPVAGRNLALCRGGWDVVAEAESFYQQVENVLGCRLYHRMSIRRALHEEAMVQKLERKLADPGYAEMVRLVDPEEGSFAEELGPEIEVRGGGWLDGNAFLKKSGDRWESEGMALSGVVKPEEVDAIDDGFRWGEIEAKSVVWAVGVDEVEGGVFGGEGFRPAKGEILDLKMSREGARPRMRVGTKWFLEDAKGGARAGATYDLANLDEHPSELARKEIEDVVRQIEGGECEVIGHRAGVRPVFRWGLPVVKEHPELEGVFLLNGFGSKGCLHGPGATRVLADHLFSEGELPSENEVSPSPGERLTTRAKREVAARLFSGGRAIDATAGNGHDTLFLAERVGEKGSVAAIDLQPAAIASARTRLQEAGYEGRVEWREGDHAHVLADLTEEGARSFDAIMFNLGYLPGGDREIVTRPEGTRAALVAASDLLAEGGILSVMVYPGHEGGAEEAAAVQDFSRRLGSDWQVSEIHRDGAPENSPFLLLMERGPARRGGE